MMLRFEEETAVIVGGASGIGLAIATQFADAGATVHIWDVNPATAGVAEELNGDAQGIQLDATNESTVLDAVARLDSLAHVVYAAGCGSGKYGFPFWNLEPSDWKRVWDVNVQGAVNVSHACVPRMLENPHSNKTMLFLSSIAGQIGSQTDPPYSAAKAAILNFMQCAAKDLATYGVRVNAICPGMVKTPLNRSVWQAWYDQQDEQQRQTYEGWAEEKIRKVSPLGRWQTPQDMAAMALFLASPLASNITGQTLNVDGGQVMR